MKKRPLCVFCVLVIVILCITGLSGYRPWYPDNQLICSVAEQQKEVRIDGYIYQREYKDERNILYLKQAVLSVTSHDKYKIEHVKITCEVLKETIRVGDFVRVFGELKPVEAATNPGQFDPESYYRSEKIGYTMWNPEIQVIRRPLFSLHHVLNQLKERISASLKAAAPDETGTILAAMVTGDKSDLGEDITSLFRQGGISHVLAISGLHLGILGMGLYKLLRRVGMPLRPAGILAVAFMCCYGGMVGTGISTLRALLMFGIKIGGDLTGRTYDPPTALALTALVLLAGNPAYLTGSSFWLSFSAVLSLMIWKGKQKLAGGICLHFFMAPILLYFFYEISFYGILLNLIVLPTVSVVLISGFLGGIVGIFATGMGKIFVLPARYILYIYEYLCNGIVKLPGAVLILGRPTLAQIGLYYGIMALVLYAYRKNRIYKKRFFFLLLMIPAWILLCFHRSNNLKITMLDVGQGDAIVLQIPGGHAYLLDGGSSSEKQVGTYRILPFLKQAGVRHLEAIFLTHDDSDHMNGIVEILEAMERGESNLEVGRLVLPKWQDTVPFAAVIELAEALSIPVCYMGAGDCVRDGKTEIICLHPSGEDYSGKSNEGSLVLLIRYGEFDGLFTGDLEGNAEKQVGEISPDIDLLKVAHHGSGYSSSEDFLKQTRPELCLISCSENNRYGHPDAGTLERLDQCGGRYFITKDCGAISVFTDGEKIDLKTYCKYNGTGR